MPELRFSWLMLFLAIPAACCLLGVFPVEAERYRRLTLGAACLLLLTTLAALGVTPDLAAGALTDPWDPGLSLLGRPLLRIDALSAPLMPFTTLLWILAVGVTPRMALARSGIRRTALATLVMLAMFLTESPALLLILWAASSVLLLRALVEAGHRRAHRLAALYLGMSTLLLAAGVIVGHRAPGSDIATACILLAVMIRSGIFPLHGWLPEAFEHGRIGPIVLYVAPQAGAYVAIALLIPRAPARLLMILGMLALGTAVYGAVMMLIQRDARRAIGYLFVSQSSLVIAGLECVSVEGLTGGLCLWLSSGIAFAALARCLAVLEARRGRLSLDRFNGGYERMPLLASSFLLTALAAVGFPGTLGFIGHELLVDGTVAQFPRTGFLVVAATAFGAIGLMRIYFALFCGRTDPAAPLRLKPGEIALFAGFSALLLITGLVPRPVVNLREAAAVRILEQRRTIRTSVEPQPTSLLPPAALVTADRNDPLERPPHDPVAWRLDHRYR